VEQGVCDPVRGGIGCPNGQAEAVWWLICRLVGVQLAQGASAVSQMFGFPFTVIMTERWCW